MSLSMCFFSLLLAMESFVLLLFQIFPIDMRRSGKHDYRYFCICEISCCTLLCNVFLLLQQSVLFILWRKPKKRADHNKLSLLLSVAISFRFSYFVESVFLSLWVFCARVSCISLVSMEIFFSVGSFKEKSEIKHAYLVFRANLIVTDLRNFCIFFFSWSYRL